MISPLRSSVVALALLVVSVTAKGESLFSSVSSIVGSFFNERLPDEISRKIKQSTYHGLLNEKRSMPVGSEDYLLQGGWLHTSSTGEIYLVNIDCGRVTENICVAYIHCELCSDDEMFDSAGMPRYPLAEFRLTKKYDSYHEFYSGHVNMPDDFVNGVINRRKVNLNIHHMGETAHWEYSIGGRVVDHNWERHSSPYQDESIEELLKKWNGD